MSELSASNNVFRRWTLQIEDCSELKPKLLDRDDVDVRRVEIPVAEFNRFLHEVIGKPFRWGGREDWSLADWVAYAQRDELETWVLYLRGAPAGYFETEHFDDGSARIHNFGLLHPFIGQGLGAHLLSFAIMRAFERGAQRIWLRTCSKDHPHALANYQARGFRIVHVEDIAVT